MNCIAPGGAEKADGKAVRPFPAAAVICATQQFDRAQCAGRGGHGAELERAQEQRPEPVQHRPGPFGECRQIRLVRAGKLPSFCHAYCQPVPADGDRNRSVQVRAVLLGLNQRGAQLREQADLVVDRARIA